MATYTSNLNLKKPNADDFYNVADFNGNADILDTEVAKKANKVAEGTEGNFVKLDENGDIADSGTSASDLQNAINTVNDLQEAFTEYLQTVGGFKKYTEAGTYTFRVPIGITSIRVSAIGGGGGGASGATGNTSSNGLNLYGGSGGGGGGRGTYILDQSIAVTAGETLTVTVGEGGSGGVGVIYDANYYYGSNGIDGSSGTPSAVKRGNDTLISASGGTSGAGGKRASENGSCTGGAGGSIDGTYGTGYSGGQNTGVGGASGIGGTVDKFGIYGNGGNGSNGGNAKASSLNAQSGTNGALAICYGSYVFDNIVW